MMEINNTSSAGDITPIINEILNIQLTKTQMSDAISKSCKYFNIDKNSLKYLEPKHNTSQYKKNTEYLEFIALIIKYTIILNNRTRYNGSNANKSFKDLSIIQKQIKDATVTILKSTKWSKILNSASLFDNIRKNNDISDIIELTAILYKLVIEDKYITADNIHCLKRQLQETIEAAVFQSIENTENPALMCFRKDFISFSYENNQILKQFVTDLHNVILMDSTPRIIEVKTIKTLLDKIELSTNYEYNYLYQLLEESSQSSSKNQTIFELLSNCHTSEEKISAIKKHIEEKCFSDFLNKLINLIRRINAEKQFIEKYKRAINFDFSITKTCKQYTLEDITEEFSSTINYTDNQHAYLHDINIKEYPKLLLNYTQKWQTSMYNDLVKQHIILDRIKIYAEIYDAYIDLSKSGYFTHVPHFEADLLKSVLNGGNYEFNRFITYVNIIENISSLSEYRILYHNFNFSLSDIGSHDKRDILNYINTHISQKDIYKQNFDKEIFDRIDNMAGIYYHNINKITNDSSK